MDWTRKYYPSEVTTRLLREFRDHADQQLRSCPDVCGYKVRQSRCLCCHLRLDVDYVSTALYSKPPLGFELCLPRRDRANAVLVREHWEISVTERVQRALEAASLLFSVTEQTSKLDFRTWTAIEILRLAILAWSGDLERVAKAFCAWPLAKALEQEIPVDYLFCDYRNFLGPAFRRLILCYANRKLWQAERRGEFWRSLWVTVCNRYKRCFLPVSNDFVRKALLKHRLGTSCPPEDLTEEEESRVKRYIDAMVCEIFPATRESLDRYHPVPSINASYHSSRRDGGAICELGLCPRPADSYETCHGLDIDGCRDSTEDFLLPPVSFDTDYGSKPDRFTLSDTRSELLRMFYHPKIGVREVRGCPVSFPRNVPAHRDDIVTARAVPIIEPLKVRVITIGEAAPYYRAYQWDRMVRRYLRDHPVFQLLHKPLDLENDPDQRIIFFDSPWIISGDYEAASDTVRSDFSEYLVRAIGLRLGLPQSDTNCVVNCLIHHNVEYPADYDIEPFEQRNGQYMGSYASFTVLSMLNAVANWIFLSSEGKGPKDELREQPLLINGDDCLVGAESRDLERWVYSVGLLGFRRSLGKNYISPYLICGNSQFYTRRELCPGFFSVNRIWDLPLNILYGQSRVLSGDRSDLTIDKVESEFVDNSVRSKVSTLVRGHPECLRRELLARFIRKNRKLLDQAAGRSWWLPCELGGVGLPWDLRPEMCATSFQRTVAARLLDCPDPIDVSRYLLGGCEASSPAGRAASAAERVWAESAGMEFGWVSAAHVNEFANTSPFSTWQFMGLGLHPYEDDERRALRARMRHYAAYPRCVSDAEVEDFLSNPRRAVWAYCPRTEADLSCAPIEHE